MRPVLRSSMLAVLSAALLLAAAPTAGAVAASGWVKEVGVFTGKQVVTDKVTFDGKNMGTVACTNSTITGTLANNNATKVIDATVNSLTFGACTESKGATNCTVVLAKHPVTNKPLFDPLEGFVTATEDTTGVNRTGFFKFKGFGASATLVIGCPNANPAFTCAVEINTSLTIHAFDGGSTGAGGTNTTSRGRFKVVNQNVLTGGGTCPTTAATWDADWVIETTAGGGQKTVDIEAAVLQGNAPNVTMTYGAVMITCATSVATGVVGAGTIDVDLTFASCMVGGMAATVSCTGIVTFTVLTLTGGGSATGTVDLDSGFSCSAKVAAVCTISVKGPEDPANDDPFTATTDTLALNVNMSATRTGSVLCGPASGTLNFQATYDVTPASFSFNP